MEALELSIFNKTRNPSATPAHLHDFQYSETKTVSAELIVNHPQITLSCLDDDNRQAIFVETPVEANLYNQPFLYLAQHEHAQKLFLLPYETLYQLAQQLEAPKSYFIPWGAVVLHF